MEHPTGLTEDLAYLQSQYGLDSSFVESLPKSQSVAQEQIQLLKTKLFTTCVLPILLALTLIGLAFLWRERWVGFASGGLGGVASCYFFFALLKQKNAITEVEKIAKYHGLI